MSKPRVEPTTPAAPNGRDVPVLEHVRALFRDHVVFGPEVPPLARDAARSPGFDPEHNALDAKILTFVSSANNYGRHWKHDRPPHLWEKNGGDAKLDQLFAEEEGLRKEFERLEAEFWAARDALSAARVADGGSAAIPALTKTLDHSIKTWQKAKLALEAAKGKRSERQLFLQENYRRAQAAK